MNNMQEVLDLLQMIFDTIRMCFLIILGRGDEVEKPNFDAE